MSKLKVGFIGLGLMGGPMAKNIYHQSFPLAVYNRSSKRLVEFKQLKGVVICQTPAEVAQNSDVVITMVTGPEDVEEVLFGPSGVVEGAKKGLMVVDMSTIGPQAAQVISNKLKVKSIEFL